MLVIIKKQEKMEEKEELKNKRIYEIIMANGGTSRWPNLYAVNFIANWMDGDTSYIYLVDDNDIDPQYAKYRPWDWIYPCYWAFYTPKMTRNCYSDTDKEPYVPSIAFGVDDNREGLMPLRVKVMSCPYFFSYNRNDNGDEFDLKEKEINGLIERVCPGLSSFEIDNSYECEDKLCQLLDIIQLYVFLQKLGDKTFILSEPRCDEEQVDFECLWMDLWEGYESIVKQYFEEIILDDRINDWVDLRRRKYVLQRLGLVYAYMAVVEDADWLLQQIRDIQVKEGVTLNGVTISYLKDNEESLTHGNSKEILKDIFEMSE